MMLARSAARGLCLAVVFSGAGCAFLPDPTYTPKWSASDAKTSKCPGGDVTKCLQIAQNTENIAIFKPLLMDLAHANFISCYNSLLPQAESKQTTAAYVLVGSLALNFAGPIATVAGASTRELGFVTGSVGAVNTYKQGVFTNYMAPGWATIDHTMEQIAYVGQLNPELTYSDVSQIGWLIKETCPDHV